MAILIMEKEKTPIQVLVKNIDDCLNSNKYIVSPHHKGFVEGVLEIRKVCEQLIESEAIDIARTFERGKESNGSISGAEYIEQTYGKIVLSETPIVSEIKASTIDDIDEGLIEGSIWDALFVGYSRNILQNSSVFSKYAIYFLMTLSMFLMSFYFIPRYLITFQFSSIKAYPKKVQKHTDDFKKFLKL